MGIRTSFVTLITALIALCSCASTQASPTSHASGKAESEDSQISQFVKNWFAGFDRHESVSFFSAHLHPEAFKIQFPDREPITTVSQFKSWLSEVDKYTSVQHRILSIQTRRKSLNKASVAIRVDWSAVNGEKPLFFPANQLWTLKKVQGNWKISDYAVKEAAEARYSENLSLVDRYFANFDRIAEGWDRFVNAQNAILSPHVRVSNRYDGKELSYLDLDGFYQSIQEWSERFETQGSFSYDVVEMSSEKVTVLIRSQLTDKGLLRKHSWLETFHISGGSKISGLDVMMNLDRKFSEATDANGLNPIMRAAAMGDMSDLQSFAKNGAKLDIVNHKGASALTYAAQNTKSGRRVFEFFEQTLPQRSFSTLLNTVVIPNSHSVALEAVFNVNTSVVEYLLKLRKRGLKVDFSTPTVFGWTPRSFAERESMPFAQALPQGAVNVNNREEHMAQKEREWLRSLSERELARHEKGLQLIQAAKSLNNDEVRRLAQEIDINGRYGRLGATVLNSLATPGLSQSEETRLVPMIRLLLDLGASPLQAEGQVMQVSHGFREAVFGYDSLLKAVLDSFPNLESKSKYINVRGPLNGYTKLIDAALRGRVSVLRLLLEEGADTSITGHNGMTAAEAALLYNRSRGQNQPEIPPQVLSALKS